MSDPKDELRARFDEQADTDEPPADADNTENSEHTDNSSNPSNASNSSAASNSDNPTNTEYTSSTSDSRSASTTESTATSPGPSKDATATRHRRQVPMYLPDEKATALNDLYERIDARSKIAGNGGIEKHADFMEQLVEFAIDNESELADRLGVE